MSVTIGCVFCGRPKTPSTPCPYCHDAGRAPTPKSREQRLRELAAAWEDPKLAREQEMFGAATARVTLRRCAAQLREVLDAS